MLFSLTSFDGISSVFKTYENVTTEHSICAICLIGEKIETGPNQGPKIPSSPARNANKKLKKYAWYKCE